MNALRELVRMPVVRATAGGAVLVCAAAALAACGAAAAPASHPAGPAAGASTSAGGTAAACLTSELKVTLDSSAAGAAAGSSYVPLEFTNESGRSCAVSGYPAVAFASAAGGPQIGTAATAEQNTHTAGVMLAPGAVAHAWLQIADVASFPASRCKPIQAGGLRVAVAGAQAAAFLPHSFQACADNMPGSTLLAVFPVQPGHAERGTAP